jgi:glycosyltransferase involved in cell wall biosynthesis
MSGRVDLLINSLRGGGAEKVCVSIANGLVEKGYIVNLVVLDLKEAVYTEKLNQEVNLVNLNTSRARKSYKKLQDYIKTNNPHQFLVFNYELALILILIRIINKSKFLTYLRSINTISELNKTDTFFLRRSIKQFLIRLVYTKADLVIAQSEGMKTDLVTNLGVPSEKVIVIHNPIDKKIYEYDEKFNSKHQEEASDFLFVGRLAPQKNISDLMKAFKICLEKRPGLKMKVVGEGPLKNELISYANKIGIKNNVIFCDFKKDLIPIYLNTRTTVLSSRFEGFPNVLLESIALGIPVVSYNCPSGPSEIIDHGRNGFLVEHYNVKDLALRMIKAVDYNWNKTVIVNSAKKFSPDYILEEYIEVLNSKLGE